LDILTLATLLFVLLFGAYLRELALWHSLKRTTLFARYLFGLAPLCIFAYVGLDLFYLFRNGTSVVVPLCKLYLMRTAALLPQNLWALSAIALLPALAMYWLLEWQFARAEMTGPLMPARHCTERGMEPQ
jgi:hypothetical protein